MSFTIWVQHGLVVEDNTEGKYSNKNNNWTTLFHLEDCNGDICSTTKPFPNIEYKRDNTQETAREKFSAGLCTLHYVVSVHIWLSIFWIYLYVKFSTLHYTRMDNQVYLARSPPHLAVHNFAINNVTT